MQGTDEYHRALVYLEDEPNTMALFDAYQKAIAYSDDYRDQTRIAYDDRHEYWPNKTTDQRKHGPGAFPWEGASDLETRIVEDKLRTLVSILVDALERSHIQAYPVETGDAARARVVSSFLKWMLTSWIKNFDIYADRTANYFTEKALMVTHVGWNQQVMRRKEEVSLEDIAAQVPELAEAIETGTMDDPLIGMLGDIYDVPKKAARKFLKQLRKDGVALLPTAEIAVDCPMLSACSPDSEVIFPSDTTDVERAPWVVYRDYLTPQEILSRVQTDGWDADWADYIIEHYRGHSTLELEQDDTKRTGTRFGYHRNEKSELVEILWFYQRLIDEDDGAEGIYCTVFQPHYAKNEGSPQTPQPQGGLPQSYAKREFLNGYTRPPIVATEMCCDEKRLYEATTIPDMIRGAKNAVKAGMDGTIDHLSKGISPELLYPNGRPPNDRGPGRMIGYRNMGEYQYLEQPRGSVPDTMVMDERLRKQIDQLLGLDDEDPHSMAKRSYYVRKYLKHIKQVLEMCYELYKLHGPEELFFRVTGVPEQMQMLKVEDEELDININFDTLYSDPESIEKVIQMLFMLVPMDKSGRINMDALITYAASAISPTLAAQILQPSEEGTQQLLQQFAQDWAQIWAGIPVDPPPNGAPVILAAAQGLQQQADVVARYGADEAFAERANNYVQKLQFQIQQTQNAEIGRRGAEPSMIASKPAPYPEQNGQVPATAGSGNN